MNPIFRLTVPVLLVGLGILATAVVFSLSPIHPLEIYILAALHLFLLFTVAMISHKNRLAILATDLENTKKADQLSEINRDLLNVMAQQKETEQRYRILLETATDAILIAQDGVIKFTNPRTIEMFGYTKEELMATPFAAIIHPDDREMMIKRHQDRLQGQTPPTDYTFRCIDKSGDMLWLQIHTVITHWENHPATLNFIQNITLQKQMEQQIQQSQKMEAIGTLASGIAHDFNNILSGIFAYVQLAQNHAHDPVKVKKDIKQIRAGAEKAADLSRQILTVSRKSEPCRKPVAIHSVVLEVLTLLKATLPAFIDIRKTIESRATILADPGKIHQVVLNLCTNAFQAMADNGQGTLSVNLFEIQVFQDPGLVGQGIPQGDYLCLSIGDTGAGIDLKTQGKMFDPYFTTKAPGKGTGLGLAMVLGIIEEHQGHIRVASEQEKGSEFMIFFPLSNNTRSS